jgi:hypothetical protein
MLRRILKIVAWIAGGIIGLVLLLYLAIVAVNWRDAQPSAEAVRFAELHRSRPAVADEDNAYVDLLGFEAARAERPQREAAVTAFIDTCRVANADCAAAFDTHKDVLQRWLDSEQWLLDRYQAMLSRSGWRETVPSGTTLVFPSYSPATDGQRLLMVKAKLLAAQGDYAAAQQLLENDLRFWRRVLASSDILISRLIAVSAVKRHFQLGNLIIRDLPSQASPAAWLDSISDAERAWDRCLAGEMEFATGMVRSSKPDNAFASPLFLTQDTVNQLAGYYAQVAELLDAPLDRYREIPGQAKELSLSDMSELIPPRSLYNIGGRISMGIAVSDFGDYASRVADLEGVRRAALAALTLREQKVAASEVAAALAASELRSPYDDQPFAWDEQAGAIVFRGLTAGERGEYRIYY